MSRSACGLAHPLWLASLALLVVNDHLLKGAGLLPGWLTGKLSDFAGLIVAPALFVVIVRARRAGARAVACAVVAAVFAAIKLSPSAAHALERALALAYVPWRVWSDPTDLVALVVLPAAWRLTGRRAVAVRAVRVPAGVRERLLVIAGAAACLATSVPGPQHSSGLSLINRTSAPHPVALYRADPSLDCAAIEARNFSVLATTAFTLESCTDLDPGVGLPFGSIVLLNEGGSPSDAGDGAGAHCDAVVIRAAGLTDTLLAWPAFALDTADLRSAQLYLEEAGSRLYIAGTEYVDAMPAAFTLPPSGCAGVP